MPPPDAAHREAGAQDGGIAVLRGERQAAFDVGDELRLRRFEADLPHRVFEEQAVFGLLDGVDFGADQLDAVAYRARRLRPVRPKGSGRSVRRRSRAARRAVRCAMISSRYARLSGST